MGRQLCTSTSLTAVRRGVFSHLSALGELFQAAFLKGKEGLDTTALPDLARTECLPGGDTRLRAKQVRFQETSSTSLGHTSTLPAGAELSTDRGSATESPIPELQLLYPESFKTDRLRQSSVLQKLPCPAGDSSNGLKKLRMSPDLISP